MFHIGTLGEDVGISMRKFLLLFLISALTLSFGFNVWQVLNIQSLNSQIDELAYLKEQLKDPMVHLIDYEWEVVILDWEHQLVEVNFTLFNSGLSLAEFTLSIDLFDGDEHVASEEWMLNLNGTTVETLTKRFYLTKPAESCHIDCIEFYSIYFFENSKGYESPIH